MATSRSTTRRSTSPPTRWRRTTSSSLGSRAAKNAQVTASVEAVKGRGVPKWLELDAAGMKGRVLSMPARDDVNFPIQEQLIVELYSK